MRLVKRLLITEEEEKHLQWVIDWYNSHDDMLEAYGVNVENDLYEIIGQVLMEGEISEEAEED